MKEAVQFVADFRQQSRFCSPTTREESEKGQSLFPPHPLHRCPQPSRITVVRLRSSCSVLILIRVGNIVDMVCLMTPHPLTDKTAMIQWQPFSHMTTACACSTAQLRSPPTRRARTTLVGVGLGITGGQERIFSTRYVPYRRGEACCLLRPGLCSSRLSGVGRAGGDSCFCVCG